MKLGIKLGTKTRRTMAWAALSGALLLVFAAYQHPDVVVSLANQLWNCF
jgi:hypothetical protein